MDLLEAVGFDMKLAGAELLGRDVTQRCSPTILAQIRSLLASQSDLERLVTQMVQTSTYTDATPTVERIVNSFRAGITRNV